MSDCLEEAKSLLATMIEGSKSAFCIQLTEEHVQTLAKGFRLLADQRDSARLNAASAKPTIEQAWRERDDYLARLSGVAAARDREQARAEKAEHSSLEAWAKVAELDRDCQQARKERDEPIAEMDRSIHLLSLDVLKRDEQIKELTQQRDHFRRALQVEHHLLDRANPLVAAPCNAELVPSAMIILEEACRAISGSTAVDTVRLTPVAVDQVNRAMRQVLSERDTLKHSIRRLEDVTINLRGDIEEAGLTIDDLEEALKAANAKVSDLEYAYHAEQKRLLCEVARGNLEVAKLRSQLDQAHEAFADLSELVLEGEADSAVVSVCVIELGERVL